MKAAARTLALLGLLTFAIAARSALAASLAQALQQRILSATFQVVQLKPAPGAVKCDQPLPTDLLPYTERTDRYRSIGTAFAIGPNRFVTAWHVMAAGMGSFFGPPARRGRPRLCDRSGARVLPAPGLRRVLGTACAQRSHTPAARQ